MFARFITKQLTDVSKSVALAGTKPSGLWIVRGYSQDTKLTPEQIACYKQAMAMDIPDNKDGIKIAIDKGYAYLNADKNLYSQEAIDCFLKAENLINSKIQPTDRLENHEQIKKYNEYVLTGLKSALSPFYDSDNIEYHVAPKLK